MRSYLFVFPRLLCLRHLWDSLTLNPLSRGGKIAPSSQEGGVHRFDAKAPHDCNQNTRQQSVTMVAVASVLEKVILRTLQGRRIE